MIELVGVALAGFLAAAVDGALGMGFGPTSSTILLATGVSPAATSATVNIAKTVIGVASAIAHWRFDNVDVPTVRTIAVSGAAGAVLGVTVLANVEGATVRPVLAVLLLLVGVRMLWRTASPQAIDTRAGSDGGRSGGLGLTLTGIAGGCTNGLVGTWGPVVTPALLGRGMPPRIAVGTANTAEPVVACVAAGSLITALGTGAVDGGVIAAMLLGGVAAAPLAARAVAVLPGRWLGLGVSLLLLTTQLRELCGTAGIGQARWAGYALVLALVVGVAVRTAPGRRAPDLPEPATVDERSRPTGTRRRPRRG